MDTVSPLPPDALLQATLEQPEHDQPDGSPAPRTLLICAAPRTSSNSLARALRMAGVGIAVEYFNRRYMSDIATRLSCPVPGPGGDGLAAYVTMLRRRRGLNGVFASKLQFWQFRDVLMNAEGQALFRDAVVVFLLREDIRAQAVSFAVAIESDDWQNDGGHGKPAGAPVSDKVLTAAAEHMLNEEANWRRFFLLAGIRPIILRDSEVHRDPDGVVRRIAAELDLEPDAEGLAAYVAQATRYGAGAGRKADYAAAADRIFTSRAFTADEYSQRAQALRQLRTKLARMVGR